MKKIGRVGGADPDEKVPLLVKPASDEATITTSESITEPVPESVVVEEPTSEPVPEPVAQEPVSEPAVEPVSEPVAQEPVPEPVSEPVAQEPVSEPAVEPVAQEPVAEEPVAEQAVEEPVAKSVEESVVAENINPEVSPAPPSVADALNIIADKIATAVVNKMRETGSSPNQDAEVAVPLAVSAVVKQTQLAPE
jgi:hypothetical protein